MKAVEDRVHPDWKALAHQQPELKPMLSLLDKQNGLHFDIKLIDAETGHPTATLEGHKSTILALAFSPDGRSLLSVSGDRTARLWDLETHTERRSISIDGAVWQAVVSRAGTLLLSYDKENEVIGLWSVTSGKRIASIDIRDQSEKLGDIKMFSSHGIMSVDISPDDKRLLLGNMDGIPYVGTWPQTGRCRGTRT